MEVKYLICVVALCAITAEGSPDSCAFLPKPGFCWVTWYRYWYYHALKNKCIQWHEEGCSGGYNNFGTEEECKESCGDFDRRQLCGLKADKGPCETNEWRFYYNSDTNKCEPFMYGGCGGNQNNFSSRKKCYQFCSCHHTFPLNGLESGKQFVSWTHFGDT